MNKEIDKKTFETECGKFFQSKFGEVKGYKENPALNGKYPDFKITPYDRDIYFEIYRPEVSKIKKIKDKTKWIELTIKGITFRYTDCPISWEKIVENIWYLMKKKYKETRQLPKDNPNIVVLDISLLFTDNIFMMDYLSLKEAVENEVTIFDNAPDLTGVIFWGLRRDQTQKDFVRFMYNKRTRNRLTESEKNVVEENLKYP